MRHIPFLLLLAFSSLGRAQGTAAKADSLTRLYLAAQAAEGPDVERMAQRFFNAFPGTFQQFVNVYGYREFPGDSTVFGPLHTRLEHLDYFNRKPPHVEADEFFAKVVSLAVGGKWQADNVSVFQQRLQDLALANVEEFAGILKKRNPAEIRSFFHFLYDGPHPANSKQDVESLKQKLKNTSPTMALLLDQEYRKVLKEWEQE